MSYLDVPRLHFTGTLRTDPSTINNDPENYTYQPKTNPIKISLAWNPYGSHAWTINATVRSFVDINGQLHTSGDPLIGASFESYMPQDIPAKLVDLDPYAGAARLFGLYLQLVLAGGGKPSFQGEWGDRGTLVNLWFRVPSLAVPQGGDAGFGAFGGAFQSVLQNLVWQDVAGSALLQQLQQAPGAVGLSVRLNAFGYQDDSSSPNYKLGSITGTIGPAYATEPLHLPPRLLSPTSPGSPLYYAPAKVSSQGTTVTLDLGNSIPDQALGGPPVCVCPTPQAPPMPPPPQQPPCTMQAAVFSGQTPTILGCIDYQGTTFQQTAGMVQFPITPEQAGQPLAILVKDSAGNSMIPLMENTNGLYIDVDGASVYMNPGDQVSVNLWATCFGLPAADVPVPLALVPQGVPDPNNTPAYALNFPSSVTTDANGTAPIPLQARNPFPLPPGRKSIGGQLYFVGGPWAAGNVFHAPLTAKLFTSIEPPIPNPTWSDVWPILYKYYYLYPYMASIVDLSTYSDVVANAPAIQHVLTLPFSDPSYMPVSREMSNDERNLILSWIKAGCPS
jgi:hypothetical protein